MIPKNLEQQILKLLPSELAAKLQEIQRNKGKSFGETLERMVRLYCEIYEFDKDYNFVAVLKTDKNKMRPIEDWEL